MENKDRDYYLFALKILAIFGVIILLPLGLFVSVGIFLDSFYQQTPRFKIAGFIIAAVVSGSIIYNKSKKFGSEFQKLSEKNN